MLRSSLNCQFILILGAILLNKSICAASQTNNSTAATETNHLQYHYFDVILSLVGLLYVFLGLAIVCDDFLVPAIEVLCDKFDIPEEV